MATRQDRFVAQNAPPDVVRTGTPQEAPPVVHTEHPFVPARSHRQANKLLSDWNLRPRGKSSIVGEFGIDDVCDNDVWSYDGWTNAFLEESVTQVLLDRQSTDRRAFALKQEMKDELSDLATRANLPPTKILDGEQIALRDMKATRQKYGAPYSAPPKLSAWSSAIQKVHFATKPDSNVGIGAEDAPEVDDVIEISVVQDALEPRCESKYNGIAKVPMSLRNVLVRTERDSLLNDIPGPVDGKSWEVPLLKKVERDYQVAKMQWKSYCIARQTSNAITQNHRERRGLSIPGITSDDDDFKEVFRRAYDPSEPPSKSDLERFMEVAIENGRRARDSRSQGQTTTQMTAVRRPFRQIPECVLPSHPIYVKAEGEWGAVLEKRKRFGRRWHVFSEQHKDLLVFVAEGGNSDTNATIPPPVLPPREETKSQVKAVKHVFFSVEQLARRAAHPDSWLGDGAVVSDGETDSDTDDRFIIKPVGKQYGTSCRTPAPEMLSQLDRKDSKVSHKEQAQMQGACARAGKISTDNEEESRTRPPPASKPPVKPLSYEGERSPVSLDLLVDTCAAISRSQANTTLDEIELRVYGIGREPEPELSTSVRTDSTSTSLPVPRGMASYDPTVVRTKKEKGKGRAVDIDGFNPAAWVEQLSKIDVDAEEAFEP